jgi:hypothetical protein
MRMVAHNSSKEEVQLRKMMKIYTGDALNIKHNFKSRAIRRFFKLS